MVQTKRFKLGKHALKGSAFTVKGDELQTHAMIVGGTGRGKSKFLELAARNFIESETPIVVLDPHGDTVKNILQHATERHLDNRVVCIDPNQAVDEAVYPLNFLQRTSDDIATHASHIMRAIAKVFGEEDSQSKPRLERRERATLMALIEASYSMAEMLHFLSISDPRFRQHVLKRVTDPYVLSEWSEYDSISRRAEREQLLESCLNRAAKIILNEPVRRCLGAPSCNLDWEDVVRNKKIVLVNLQPTKVSRECMQLMGILILDHLVRFGTRSTRPLSSPLYVLCDELDELASPDLSYALQALRKRRIFVWGCIQYLEQLRTHDTTSKLYHSFMANADLKVVFHTTYEDAQLLVHELFAGEFRGDIVKDEIKRTTPIPVESVRKVFGTTEHESATQSSADTTGSAVSSNTVDVDMRSHAHGTNEILSPDGTIVSRGGSDIETRGTSTARGSSDVSSSQHMEGSAHTVSRGSSVSEVPFYEYLLRQELTSRTFYTIEELTEQFIAFLQCQPERHVQIKLKDRKGAPVVLSFVHPTRIREKHVLKLIHRSNERVALPPPKVDAILHERLKLPEAVEAIEDETPRWE
ncbi:MAG: DUF87 domain-containing protein [Candidatus Zixiibacteriota bacterium]